MATIKAISIGLPAFAAQWLWGFVLIISFAGWGLLLRRLLFPNIRMGIGLAATWGISLLLFLGGLANLFHIISRPFIIFLLLTGIVFIIVEVVLNRNKWGCLKHAFAYFTALRHLHNILFLAATLAVSIFILLEYTDGIANRWFNPSDDLKAYFCFPAQMLDRGSLTDDPFNLRRAELLGGMAFLQTFVLVAFDHSAFFLLDSSIGTLLAVLLIIELSKASFLNRWLILLFITSYVMRVSFGNLRINTSAFSLGVGLFLALAHTLHVTGTEKNIIAGTIIISLVASSLCALKTNFIPPAVLFTGIALLIPLFSKPLRLISLKGLVTVPLTTFVFLLPWMLDASFASGSMLYPIFGEGYHETAYGFYRSEFYSGDLSIWDKVIIAFTKSKIEFIIYFVFISGVLSALLKTNDVRKTPIALFLSVFSTWVLYNLMIDATNSFYRYMLPFLFSSVTVSLISVASPATPRALLTRRHLRIISVAILLLFIFTGLMSDFRMNFPQRMMHIKKRIIERMTIAHTSLIPEDMKKRHRDIQSSLPRGAAVLVRTSHPFLFDTKRNTLYLQDDPGSVSPPPGMPYFGKVDEIVAYLLLHGIRYIIYEYSTQAGYPIEGNLWRIYPNRPHISRRSERCKIALDLSYMKLLSVKKRLYDDGAFAVIDLHEPEWSLPLGTASHLFEAGRILLPFFHDSSGFCSRYTWIFGDACISNIICRVRPNERYIAINCFQKEIFSDGTDVEQFRVRLSINNVPQIFLRKENRSYIFLIDTQIKNIRTIRIQSKTFPADAIMPHLKYFPEYQRLGIDIDTIELRTNECIEYN